MIDLTINKYELSPRKRGNWDNIRGYSGCYIFTYNDDVIYVGRSKNLYARLVSHYSNGGICNAFSWDSIHLIFCENHKEIEKYLINKLRPIMNGSLTSSFYYR